MSAKRSTKKHAPAEQTRAGDLKVVAASAAGAAQPPAEEATPKTLPFVDPGSSRNGQADPKHSLTERSAVMTAKKTTKKPSAKKPARQAAKPRRAPKAAAPAKLSALNAAVRVLEETKQPMSCPEMIAAMAAKGYWTSPAGKTPSSTLYASILKETKTKGRESRFRKTARGKFGLNS